MSNLADFYFFLSPSLLANLFASSLLSRGRTWNDPLAPASHLLKHLWLWQCLLLCSERGFWAERTGKAGFKFHAGASASSRLILALWHIHLWLRQSYFGIRTNCLWLCTCLRILIVSAAHSAGPSEVIAELSSFMWSYTSQQQRTGNHRESDGSVCDPEPRA